jgi:hypothetical protein
LSNDLALRLIKGSLLVLPPPTFKCREQLRTQELSPQGYIHAAEGRELGRWKALKGFVDKAADQAHDGLVIASTASVCDLGLELIPTA